MLFKALCCLDFGSDHGDFEGLLLKADSEAECRDLAWSALIISTHLAPRTGKAREAKVALDELTAPLDA